MNTMNFEQRIEMMLISIVPFLMCIVFHEMGHAWAAKKYGDNTAEDMGRLTLNPLPHIDPIGTILLPVINMISGIPVFGWAKPVPINFNKLKPYRRGLFLTALAGPGANVILALIIGLFIVLMVKFVPSDFYLYEPLIKMAKAGIQINYALAIFNMIPLPPLDGSKLIEAFMNYNTVKKFEQLQTYSFLILFGLLFTGALNILSYPIFFLSNFSVDIWARFILN